MEKLLIMNSKFFDKTLSRLNNQTNHPIEFDFSLFSGFFSLFISIIKCYKNELVKAKLYTLASSISTFTVYILSGYLFSHLYDIDTNHSFVIFIAFFILIISASIFTYLNEMQFKLINANALAAIMPQVWKHILSLPIASFNQQNSAETSKMVADYESSLAAAISTISTMISSAILFLMILAFMFYCSFQLTLLYFLTYLLLIICKLVIFPSYMRLTNAHLASQGRISAFLNESLLQIHKIRTSGAEQRIHNKWLALLIDYKIKLESATIVDIKIWLIESITPAALLFILYSYLSMTNTPINTPTMLQFLVCAGQLSILFEGLSGNMISFSNLLTGVNRLTPMLIDEPEPNLLTHTEKKFFGKINLTNVCVKKNNSQTMILEDISIQITPGSFTALAGPSGAGKSTIFKLILGLMPPSSGSILIDDNNINDINIRAFRKHIGVVLQTTSIFPGTILSNICANTKLTLDEAWELASYVGLADDIKAMPMKMFTHLSDNPGDSISGGQKQKILIARALATKPNILLLDEATSALDNASQTLIFNNLKLFNVTLIVIAHRHSTIVDADVIYYLDNGRITDKGTYAELALRLGW